MELSSKGSNKNMHESFSDDADSELPVGIRQKIGHLMSQTKFHILIICMVMGDLIIVMIELLLSQYISSGECTGHVSHHTLEILEELEHILGNISFTILSLFVLEVITRIWAIGLIGFFIKLFNVMDFLIVIGSFVLEIMFEYVKINISGSGNTGDYSKAIIVLRMLRIIRMLHAVAHGVEMMAHKKIERLKECKKEVESEVLILHEKIDILTFKLLQMEEEQYRNNTSTRL